MAAGPALLPWTHQSPGQHPHPNRCCCQHNAVPHNLLMRREFGLLMMAVGVLLVLQPSLLPNLDRLVWPRSSLGRGAVIVLALV